MGLFSKYLSSWVLAAILSGKSDAMLMWREVHKQHLEVLWCSQIQSAYINATPNKRNLCQIFLFLSFFLSFYFHSFALLSPVFFYVYIYIWVCGCVCGSDLVIVDRMITGLSVLLSPQRKHICSKSPSLHKHAPRLPLTRCIMSVLCPIDQMTITVEPWRRLQKVHLSLSGPGTLRDPNSQTVAQLQSRTEAPAHYPCKGKRGVNDP